MYHEMLVDAIGPQGEYNEDAMAEEPNHKAREFYELLHAVEVHIGSGEQNVTVLSWMAEMLNMKTHYNMSASNWEMTLSLSRKLLSAEDQEKVPKDFYTAKKMINVLGLGYKKIDVCINDCFLYYDEQSKNLNACPVCGESRYELRNMAAVRQKAVPRKSLWYFPIIPRLQRLYMSRKIAEHMTWHLKCSDDSDEVIHLVGSQAWKHFDETYPTFAAEPRNVRLGLCTDGFNPFGPSASAYSCWPVFLTVYNLPPELCMNSEHIFLSMIIAGPKSPGKNIDVLLRPLIDELNELWTNGVETYDNFRKQNFIMKAALLWTVCSGRYEVDPRLLTLVTGPVSIVIHPSSRIVDINPQYKLQTNEPFILASQAQQVFYTSYPSKNPRKKGWYAACKIRARAIIDTSSLGNCVNNYQDDDPLMLQLVQPSTIVDDHVPLASSGGERVVIGEDLQLSYSAEQNEEECVDEDDEEEDEFEGTETPEEEVLDYFTESDSD
ncbi:hypothetical protein SLEP1_g44791 [Rubroshorea leprosula]|uniref:DUF4216 domain-containing protein n=1 Tax=Rubroshorea leprosula TaxID=152421 RepID=A0AAV5LHV4_9ROSI|nr:hypothetical protein SLEP1_g44791 [Rubroshorea leprosula]